MAAPSHHVNVAGRPRSRRPPMSGYWVGEVKTRAVYASRVDWPLATAQTLASVIDGRSRRDALPGVHVRR